MQNKACYGLASLFCAESPTCQECKDRSGCLDEVLASLTEISKGINVDKLMLQHMKNKQRLERALPDKEALDTAFNALVQLKPAKDKTEKPNLEGKSELVKKWIDACWKAGLKSPDKIEDSKGLCLNRLRKIPPFVSLMVLTLRAGFSNKKLLIKELWSRTKLTNEEFKENYKAAVETLRLLKLIEERGDDITLRC